MPISVICTCCGSRLRASHRAVGRKAKCPNCHTGFVVTGTGSVVPRLGATEITPKPLPPAIRHRPSPPPQLPSKFEFAPCNRPRSANNFLGVIAVCSVALALIVIGIAVFTRTTARPWLSINTGYRQPTTTDPSQGLVAPEARVRSSGSARQPGREVNVRSYVRRDGTTVNAHTRSAPGSGSSSRSSSRGGRR